MKRLFFLLLISGFLSCGQTYYVVRHAEKAQASLGSTMNTTNDPPLSAAGRDRAEALKNQLTGKRIRYIFSTNTIRTLRTIAPLSLQTSIKPEIYTSVDAGFINRLKSLEKNTVIVGHSNTVDDIVNGLAGKNYVPADLPDSVYNMLFIVKRRGGEMTFQALEYGD